MNIEHKLEPVEHWIVNGKAYRLATEADVGKGVLLTDYELSTRGNVPDVAHELKSMSYMAGGNVWKYAYIQDDSLLSPPAPERTPVSVPEPKPIDWTYREHHLNVWLVEFQCPSQSQSIGQGRCERN